MTDHILWHDTSASSPNPCTESCIHYKSHQHKLSIDAWFPLQHMIEALSQTANTSPIPYSAYYAKSKPLRITHKDYGLYCSVFMSYRQLYWYRNLEIYRNDLYDLVQMARKELRTKHGVFLLETIPTASIADIDPLNENDPIEFRLLDLDQTEHFRMDRTFSLDHIRSYLFSNTKSISRIDYWTNSYYNNRSLIDYVEIPTVCKILALSDHYMTLKRLDDSRNSSLCQYSILTPIGPNDTPPCMPLRQEIMAVVDPYTTTRLFSDLWTLVEHYWLLPCQLALYHINS